MINIDGFTITPELIEFLKSYVPDTKQEDTLVTVSANNIAKIQDHFCRNIGNAANEDKLVYALFLEALVDTKDILSGLAKLLSQTVN